MDPDNLPEYNRRPRVKNKRILRERIEKYISPIYFSDVNLFSKLYCHTHTITSAYHYHAPGRISFEEAAQPENFKLINLQGQSFGPTWSTHWFRVSVDLSVNENWRGKEVRLRWNSGGEAMLWSNDGIPLQGLTGGDGQVRTDYVLTNSCIGNELFEVYVEMAVNGMFGAGNNGMIQPPDPNRYFSVSMAQISTLDLDVYGIIRDLKIIIDMAENFPEESEIAHHALQVGCDVVNCCQAPLTVSYEKAEKMLDKFFRGDGKSISTPSRTRYCIHAMGHCHIDTAWLWPYAETERKCARSWSSVIGLMKRYPEFKFSCSQAVQYEWVKTKYPQLYEEVRRYASLGRFNFTGGTWVEMDGNIPSGEAFVRQFLYGQQFFKREFGSYCQVFWLPDTFGYSAQLPQIMRAAGIDYFLTQKLSWSLINKFPHNSFVWQGIDGSECLAHFPPADTYESSVSVKDVLKTREQNKERGIVSDGMLLYGYGDGGGGPTEDMIENLNRMKHVDEFPLIRHSTPLEFYTVLDKYRHLLHTWVGELYLELHQGTFTTQARIKKYNRKCETKLRMTELLQVWAYLRSGGSSSAVASVRDMEKLWKNVLLNQFHDVLPGTSINEAVCDAWKLYEEVVDGCKKWDDIHLNIITHGEAFESSPSGCLALNVCPWQHKGLLLIDSGVNIDASIEQQSLRCLDGATMNAILVDVPSVGMCDVNQQNTLADGSLSVCLDSTTGEVTMTNEHISARFNSVGQLVSCVMLDIKRECIDPDSKGNQLCIFTDIPLYWDAWDVMPYNDETRAVLESCSQKLRIINDGPLRVSLEFSIKISDKSHLTQIVSLDVHSKFLQFDTRVDWHENRKMLKVEFPLNVHARCATYEIQYGHLERPTHCNTSWDWAKHEVCGHKWVDISEYGFGVAMLNDCKYGYSVYKSTIQLSLLRSPKAPDGEADMGCHSFSYALMPHIGSFQSAQVIRHAYQFNNPLQCVPGYRMSNGVVSLFSVDNNAVALDALKLSEDGKHGTIIVRLYESFGSHVDGVNLTSYYDMTDVFVTNSLEERLESAVHVQLLDNHTCVLSMKPFQLLTLCMKMKLKN